MGIFRRFFRPDIARLEARRDVAGLVAALADRAMRPAAIRALSEVGDASAVDPLRDVVTQYREPAGIRAMAMRALGRIAGRSTDPALQSAIVGDLLSHVWAPVTWGPPDLADQVMSRESAAAILDAGAPAAVGPLVAALSYNSYGGREAAIQMLTRMGAPAFDAVRSALQAPVLRDGAARVLGRLGDPRAFAPLVELLADGNGCGAAATALAELGDPRAVAPLALALTAGNHDRAYCSTIAESLRAFGGQAEPALVEALSHPDANVRAAAAGALIEMGTDASVDGLVACLGDPESEVAAAAAKALDRLGWRPAEEGQRVTTAIATRRWADVVAIGVAAVPALLRLLSDARKGVHAYLMADILRTLGSVGDRRAVDALLREIVDGPGRRPEATQDDLTEHIAKQALVQVLRRHGAQVPAADLRRICALRNQTLRLWPTKDGEAYKGVGQFDMTIDLTDLRAAARETLDRPHP